MVRRLLFTLILFLVLLSPAISAADYDVTGATLFVTDWGAQQTDEYNGVTSITYDGSEDGEAINLVHFKVPSGSYVNFTLYYGTDKIVTGSAQNSVVSWLPPTTTSYVTLNGETKSYTFWDTNPEFDYNLAGYARERDTNTSGFIVYHAGYGSFDDDLAVFMPVANIGSNLIYRVTLTSPGPFDADISHATYSAVSSAASKSAIDQGIDFVNYAISISGMVLSFVIALVYWFKFFFIDNLMLTVSLYLAGSMAFAAKSCRGNPERFLRRFIGDQVKLMQFIISLPEKIVNILSAIRGIFKLV